MKKLLALTLVLVTVVSLFAGCGGGSDEIVLPTQNVEDTVENRQKAMVEIAKAYFAKNPYVQYDEEPLTPQGRGLGVRNASNMNNTPEMAGPQRTIYHVCSFFTYICTFHTFDFKILDSWSKSYITPVATKAEKSIEPYVIFSHLNSENPEENLEAMEQFRALLQPGDLIYYTRYRKVGSNHAVMWCGDVDGDGDNDILNADGKYYDSENMEEIREPDGGIDKNTDAERYVSSDYFFFDPAAYDYFPLLKNVGIVRFSDKADELPLTERAKTRLLFPGLKIFYEAENGIYGAVKKGGEYTYTLRMENESQQDHEGILVQLPVPKNAEIVSVDGRKVKNQTLKLKLNLPAGTEIAINYTVKATGAVGDVIETGVGYVHAIPLPSLNTVIVSDDTDASAVKTAMDANKGKNGEEFLAGYLKEMGYDLTIPTAEDIRKEFCDRKNIGESKLYFPKEDSQIENLTLAKLRIPEFFGGQSVATAEDSLRVKELRNEDLLAGDVLIWMESSTSEPMVAVHNGEALVCAANGQLTPMSQYDLDRFIMYHYFIALRPTQAV